MKTKYVSARWGFLLVKSAVKNVTIALVHLKKGKKSSSFTVSEGYERYV